ncbi:MAG: phosphohexomutase domain-containing protein [Armatimonadota bacterium]
MSVYKACDIQGPVAELSPERYRRWGQVLGTALEEGEHIVVGGDVRHSTPAFKAALIDGLCELGLRVTDLGVLPTPMVDFARRHLRADACAIVTASHNPADINGLQWMIHDTPVDEFEVLALRQDAEGGTAPPVRRPGRVDGYNIAAEYAAWLTTVPYFRAAAPALRVVFDPGNGCWSRRAAACALRVFPGLQVEAIHDGEDGSFPHRSADVARPELLAKLCEVVVERRADLGIAFDGDGDRVAFVDGQGSALSAEEATWVLALSFYDTFHDRGFVYDIRFSDRIAEGVRALGGEPHMERSGHACIRRRMMDEGAIFGAEISGHYCYGELDGGDDGLFSALRMIAHLAQAEQSLAALRNTCPIITMTSDLRLPCDTGTQAAILAQVQSAFADYPQTTIDGIRIDFPDGWALVRRSVTEFALIFRFEGVDSAALDRIVREFCDRVPAASDGLAKQFQKVRS